jgi:hypothetical protein
MQFLGKSLVEILPLLVQHDAKDNLAQGRFRPPAQTQRRRMADSQRHFGQKRARFGANCLAPVQRTVHGCQADARGHGKILQPRTSRHATPQSHSATPLMQNDDK